MGDPWEADVDVSLARARRLVAAAFPDLAEQPVAHLGSGWDNAMFRCGPWVIRLPRRAMADALLRVEVAVLPSLVGRLPLSAPAVHRVSPGIDGFPYTFAAYEYLPGRTACGAGLDRHGRAALAAPIGAFLRALHGIEAPERPPGDELQRADLPYRLGLLRDRLHAAPDLRDEVEPALGDLVDTPAWSGPPRLLHGDLYARHILVDAAGRASGVIDWGDVHVGDPAVDLGIGWAFVPEEAREAFWAAYGPVDGATRRRARFTALKYAINLTVYGRSVGDRSILDVAGWALDGGLARA